MARRPWRADDYEKGRRRLCDCRACAGRDVENGGSGNFGSGDNKDRLKGVYIENESWDRCFKRYDREHTFFYADPPYWQTAGYDQLFGWEQYELLAKVMAESKGKVMLSINDHPDIRELFKDFRITQLELAYTVGRNKTGKTSGELVVCNW